jgi:hypothetical protein
MGPGTVCLVTDAMMTPRANAPQKMGRIRVYRKIAAGR